MTLISSSGLRVAYIAEVTPGVTPATPTFKTLRTTGGGIRNTKQTVMSDELRQDRNVSDLAMVGVSAAGSYNFELSYGSFDDILEGALYNPWSSNVLKNGVTPKTFTFEETLEAGATDMFSRFPRTMVDRFSLDIAARQKITGSFSAMAKQEALATAIIAGSTYTAANTKDIMSASAHVGSLTVGTLNPQPKLRRIGLEINNGLRERPVVGSLYGEQPGEGRCEISGNMEIYFETNDLAAEVLAHNAAAVTMTLGSVTTEKYTILLPKVRFGDGAKQIGGNNDDVMYAVPFTAVYDSTEQASIKITRAVV